MSPMHRICCLLVWALLFASADNHAAAAEPLHQRIDRAIAEAHVGQLAAKTNDHEFLRRVYLDLIGRIPSTDELSAFFSSNEAAKREQTINQLLASEEFDEYFVGILDIMFMERRGGARIPQDQWTSFLRVAVKQKWPFDRLARQIISADGKGEFRGAAKFLVQREVESNALTRDIGRLFFGRDLQCAQCHDHPNITDYEQSEYFGIYAFVNRSYLFENVADNNKSYVGEKGEGDVDFESVFAPDEGSSRASPTLLNGLVLDIDTKLSGGDAYIVAPSKTAAGVPKFSRRSQLARLITHPANDHFSKNIANRFWAQMLGRGLVHPLDFHHSDNPPTHPALLKMLADEFVASGFDYRELLRQIALSDTYQRSIDPPGEIPTSVAEIESRVQELNAALATVKSEPQYASFQQQLESRRSQLVELDDRITASMEQSATLSANIKKASEETAKLQKQLIASQNQLKALETAVAAARAVSQLSPQDQTLAELLAKYEQRIEPLKQDIAAKQALAGEQTKQKESLTAQLNAEKLQLGKLRNERVGVADMVAEARGALGVFRAKEQRQVAQRNELQRQLKALAVHRNYLQQRDSARGLASRPAELASKVAALAKNREALTKSIEQAELSVVVAENRVAEGQQQFETASVAMDQEKRTLADLTSAVSKAETAAAELDDPQVQEAIAVLKNKQQMLGEQVATLEQQGAELQQTLVSAQSELKPLLSKRDQLIQQRSELENQISNANAELDAAQQQWQAALVASNQSLQQLRQSWERRFVFRSLVPLTPEQLAGSTITALGLRPRFEREAENEWQTQNKDKKLEDIDEATKVSAIKSLTQKRITGVVNTYISLFAAPGGSPQDVFSATADQALFLANDGRVQNWLTPAEGTLLKRLHSVADANQIAEELSMAILSRPASEQEKQEIASYLESRKEDRNVALGELAWGMISSLEFRFNH